MNWIKLENVMYTKEQVKDLSFEDVKHFLSEIDDPDTFFKLAKMHSEEAEMYADTVLGKIGRMVTYPITTEGKEYV